MASKPRPTTLRRAAALAGFVLAAVPGAARAEAGALAPCRVPGLAQAVQCGSVQRALDPAQPSGRQIAIHYVVVPALARRKLPDPVFLLAGGPGQSAISVAPAMAALLGRLQQRRDLVFVDQRGTGRSAPLDCPDVRHQPLTDAADPERQIARLASCRQALATLAHTGGADGLRHYKTAIAVQDLDAVRRALGAEQINLVGASYGTRVALDFHRQFPQRVRRSVLDGVVPPDMVLPTSFAADAHAALDATLASCEQDPVCARAFPTLRRDWLALLASLPKVVEVADPHTGLAQRLRLTREALLGLVRGPLYLPPLAAALPAAIDSAGRGRFEPLVGLGALLTSRRQAPLSMGMHFSVVCAEDVPRMAPPDADAPAPPDLVGYYRRVCADWPVAAVPEAFYRVAPARSPVLLLSGSADPATPPRHGARMADALGPLARHVVVPNAGHGLLGVGCVREVVQHFIDAEEAAAALDVDAGCIGDLPRPPVFLPPGAAPGLAP